GPLKRNERELGERWHAGAHRHLLLSTWGDLRQRRPGAVVALAAGRIVGARPFQVPVVRARPGTTGTGSGVELGAVTRAVPVLCGPCQPPLSGHRTRVRAVVAARVGEARSRARAGAGAALGLAARGADGDRPRLEAAPR